MHLLGVFAHPDDEAYSMGGCLARYTAEGIGATILCFTRGERGMITEGSGATPATLAEVRERELLQACRIVGCTDVRVVGTPDGDTKADDEGIEAVVEVIREVRPDVLVTMEPKGVTSHPDHIAVSQMTTDAFERVRSENIVKRVFLSAIPESAFKSWMQTQSDEGVRAIDPSDPLAPRPAPDETIACIVDSGDLVRRKLDALRAHATQAQEFIAVVPEEFAAVAMRNEAFQRAHPPFSPGDRVTDDLFEGLR